jgi:hypothetical protein
MYGRGGASIAVPVRPACCTSGGRRPLELQGPGSARRERYRLGRKRLRGSTKHRLYDRRRQSQRVLCVAYAGTRGITYGADSWTGQSAPRAVTLPNTTAHRDVPHPQSSRTHRRRGRSCGSPPRRLGLNIIDPRLICRSDQASPGRGETGSPHGGISYNAHRPDERQARATG